VTNEHDRLLARVEELEAALAEALDIAEWEASEYQGKPEHLVRLPQLRDVLRKNGDLLRQVRSASNRSRPVRA
jgi:hypothetical protein